MPSLIVQTSPAGVRILDAPPYNSFLVTCIAWAEVDRKRVPLKISVDWIKWVEPQTNTGPIVQPSNISLNACVLDELSDEIYVYSTLKCNETDGDSSITYRCCASIELDANKHKREFSDSRIVVAGEYLIL